MVWIVLPTRNEAPIIRANLERLLTFLGANIREDWHVTVADNASTDATRAIVREIAVREPRVELLEIPEAGKGGAVLVAWQRALQILDSRFSSQGGSASGGQIPVYVFMDADLATDLAALPTLISAIRSGPPSRNAPAREPADIAVGSRYLPGAQTERGFLRQCISWCYRKLLQLLFGLRVSDPPCGFKAVNERVVRDIVPLVRDRQWFFDTELLIRAQAAGSAAMSAPEKHDRVFLEHSKEFWAGASTIGYQIVEIPVTWHEPRRKGSIRKIAHMIIGDLRAMWRLRLSLRRTARRLPASGGKQSRK
ncbi:MAG: glycosyltransferase [bacterium]|nr:glycosyltransferase [bacterium]